MPNLEYVLVITDQGTATIKKVAVGLQGVGTAGAQAGIKTTQGIRQAHTELTQMDRTIQRLQRTAMAFLGMWVLTKAISLPKEIISVAIDFNSQIETARLGIAAILMAQGEFTNAVMGSVQGYNKLAAAQQMSGEIVKKLQIDNLRTIATFDQLVKAFQSTVAPALEKGFNVEQTREFTVAMVQAAGALGLNLDMLAEETRSLLRGIISPRQTLIATALGITNEDIRKYQGNAEALFNYIMGRLSSFTVAGMESQKTWLGLLSNLKDMGKVVLGAGLENIFKLAKREAQTLMDSVITINEKTAEMEINPDVLESIKRLGYLFEAAYSTVKDILGVINLLRGPVDLLAEAWRSVSISIQAYQKLTGGGKEKTAKEGYVSIMGVTPKIQEPEWFGKYRGKGMVESLLMAWKQYNDYISGEGKYAIKDYMDYYQRQMEVGMTYTVRQRGLKEDEIGYLLKTAGEIGYINEKLAEQFKADMAIKGVNIDLYSYSGKQLQAVIKMVEEYSKLKDTGAETLEAFKQRLAVVLRIAAIETAETPMKIAQQLAQSTDQYEKQKEIIIELNRLAQEKLRLTNQLTPELKKQMDIQNVLAVKEADWAKQLAEVGRGKELIGLEQKYAQITNDVDSQIVGMEKTAKLAEDELKIQAEKTADSKKWLDIWDQIFQLRKNMEREVGIAKVALPITQRAPYYAAGLGLAEAISNAQAYEHISRLILDDEVKSLKATQEKNPYLQDIIKLKTQQWEIDNAIRKVEMETYGGDIVARAKANYASITGDMEAQSKTSKILLDNEIKRTLANTKLSEDQRNVLVYYLKQIEASETINRNLAKQKEILGWQQQLAVLQGDYTKSKELEIALLEKDREGLIESNKANWESVKAINEYYDKLKEISEARKNLQLFPLMEIGAQKAAFQVQEELANMYENILPNAVNIFVDSIRESDGTFKDFFSHLKEGFSGLLQDIAYTILKMEILKGLGYGRAEGGKGVISWIGSILGLKEGGIVPSLLSHYPLRAYQGGGIATSPQIGIFGEGGGSGEAFVPLKNGKIPVQIKGGEGGEGGGQQITNFFIYAMDPISFRDFARRNPDAIVEIVHKDTKSRGVTRSDIRRYG